MNIKNQITIVELIRDTVLLYLEGSPDGEVQTIPPLYLQKVVQRQTDILLDGIKTHEKDMDEAVALGWGGGYND
jgi:hypothetical protein